MHTSVIEWAQKVFTEDLFRGKRVIEVGSYDVNGSVRPFAMRHSPASYVGIDARPGRGVDVVQDITSISMHKMYDVVVCTEVLEHVKEWTVALYRMWDMLDVGGSLFLTTRGPGFPFHEFPGDYHRFTEEVLRTWFLQSDGLTFWNDQQMPGLFLHAIKRDELAGGGLPALPI